LQQWPQYIRFPSATGFSQGQPFFLSFPTHIFCLDFVDVCCFDPEFDGRFLGSLQSKQYLIAPGALSLRPHPSHLSLDFVVVDRPASLDDAEDEGRFLGSLQSKQYLIALGAFSLRPQASHNLEEEEDGTAELLLLELVDVDGEAECLLSLPFWQLGQRVLAGGIT